MNNKIPYTLIDIAGQTTAIIDVPVSRSQQPIIAKPLMKSVENIGQVCFVEKQGKFLRLQMMGNELSVNGIAAGAAYLLKMVKIKQILFDTSGTITKIKAEIKNDKISVFFPKGIVKFISRTTAILNGGIIYDLQPSFPPKRTSKNQKRLLIKSARKYPASGIIYFQKNEIQPLIYVKATNTFVWETSYGSASIAFALFSKQRSIRQPSKQEVDVTISSKEIIYSTKVTVLS